MGENTKVKWVLKEILKQTRLSSSENRGLQTKYTQFFKNSIKEV